MGAFVLMSMLMLAIFGIPLAVIAGLTLLFRPLINKRLKTIENTAVDIVARGIAARSDGSLQRRD
jgi:hypothetical protein